MFEAPPCSLAAPFAALSDAQHRPAGTSPWQTLQRPGTPPASFIEGPVFDRHGYLWICDIPWGRIFRISPSALVELVIQYDGEPNGLVFAEDGRLIIADHKNGLLSLDPETRKLDAVYDRPKGERFKGLNDLIFASNGDLYFTDQGQSGLHDPTGRLFRLTPGGRLECLLSGIPSPNGLVLDLDERTLFLAVTRDNAVWRVPLLPDGGVTKVGAFIRLSGGGGPDGLALDSAGNLAVCHMGLGTVWIFNRLGEPIRRIKSPSGSLTTNATFGPEGSKALFITESESGSVLRADMDW